MSKKQFLKENQRPGEVYAGLILGKEGNDMHAFLRSDGKVLHSDTFMRGPKAGAGKVWNRRYDNVWVEEDSPHGPESNPNHISYDLHIFGEHHESFMRRQYK